MLLANCGYKNARTATHWDRPFLHEAFHVYHHRELVIMLNKNTLEPGAITTSKERIPEGNKDEWRSLRSAHGRSCADHPSAARPRFRWLPRTCATKQPSVGTPPHPRLAREFVRGAVSVDFNLAACRLADRRMCSSEAAFPGEQLIQLAGSSPLWGSGCAPKDCCGFLGTRDTGDTWNVQRVLRVLRAQSRTGWHWVHGPIGASSCLHPLGGG